VAALRDRRMNQAAPTARSIVTAGVPLMAQMQFAAASISPRSPQPSRAS
jgi:hypothetical protein